MVKSNIKETECKWLTHRRNSANLSLTSPSGSQFWSHTCKSEVSSSAKDQSGQDKKKVQKIVFYSWEVRCDWGLLVLYSDVYNDTNQKWN